MKLSSAADEKYETPVQIADAERKVSTLYDMLDEQDATNRDAKGLPFTVSMALAASNREPV